MRRATKFLGLLAICTLACTPKGDQKADSAEQSAAASTPTLYDRLGGTPVLTAVVDSFVGHVMADTRINKYFQRIADDTVATQGFKRKLVEQLCQGASGPCTYSGLDMKSAHQGMNLTDADFDALLEDLVRALDAEGVSQRNKNELLGVLGQMRGDIVSKR